jgi:hypothetical protein
MLKALHHHGDPQSQVNEAELMTTAITSALFCGGNMEKARAHLVDYGYIHNIRVKSRICRPDMYRGDA